MQKKKSPRIKVVMSPGRFRYCFLDSLRSLQPPGFILVDELIDAFGWKLLKQQYPTAKEDFKEVANFDRTTVPQRHSKNLGQVWPHVVDAGGLGMSYIRMRTKTEEDDVFPEPPEDIIQFREAAWGIIRERLHRGPNRLTAYKLFCDGRYVKIGRSMKGLLSFQDEMIKRTGAFWTSEGMGFGQVSLLAFRYSQVIPILKKLSAELISNPQPKPIKLDLEETRELLMELGWFNILCAEPISKASVTDILNAIYGNRVLLPSEKMWRETYKSVKMELGAGSFCEDGETCFFIALSGRSSANKEDKAKRRFLTGGQQRYVSAFEKFRLIMLSGEGRHITLSNPGKKTDAGDIVGDAMALLAPLISEIGDANAKSRRSKK